MQRALLEAEHLEQKRRIVIFFVLPSRQVSGGGLQILSLHRQSRRLLAASDTSVLLCWPPGIGRDDHQLAGMKTDASVCPFWMSMDRFPRNASLILHLPEFAAERVVLRHLGLNWLREEASRREVSINILNQNRDVMVAPLFVHKLIRAGAKVTITAAPSHWASPDEQLRFGVPVHWLPTWYYQDDAEWQPFESKKDLLLVSPDPNRHRERVLQAIQRSLPSLAIQVIQGIPFEHYTELEKAAKWSLTFGEGCDGYFYGPAMRGGVSVAVYNETFTGWNLSEWRTLYASYEDLAERIVGDILGLDAKPAYEEYSLRLRQRFAKYRSLAALQRQLVDFYRGAYSLHPVHLDSSSLGLGGGYH